MTCARCEFFITCFPGQEIPPHECAGDLEPLATVTLTASGCAWCHAFDLAECPGNPLNNELSNIAVYCRRHHMLVDGRLAAAAERAPVVGKLYGGRPKGSGNVA